MAAGRIAWSTAMQTPSNAAARSAWGPCMASMGLPSAVGRCGAGMLLIAGIIFTAVGLQAGGANAFPGQDLPSQPQASCVQSVCYP